MERPSVNGGTAAQSAASPLLKFHAVHGKNVRREAGGHRAARKSSFDYAIAFSERPIRLCEEVSVRLAEVSGDWSGMLRFGVTSVDPATLRSSLLPRYSCPGLHAKDGYWIKALPDRYMVRDALIQFYVSANGNLHFSVNGARKGIFLHGLTTRAPLWVILDLYGNAKAVEFVARSPREPVVELERMAAGMRLNSSPLLPVIVPRRDVLPMRTLRSILGLTLSGGAGGGGREAQTSVAGRGEEPAPLAVSAARRLTTVATRITAHFSPNSRDRPAAPVAMPLPTVAASARLQQPQPRQQTRAAVALDDSFDNVNYVEELRRMQLARERRVERAAPLPAADAAAAAVVPPVRTTSLAASSPGAGRTAAAAAAAITRGQQQTRKSPSPCLPASSSSSSSSPSSSKPSGSPLYAHDECRVCMEEKVNAVIYKCGHMCMCYACATKLKRAGNVCPICREPMHDIIKTYRS